MRKPPHRCRTLLRASGSAAALTIALAVAAAGGSAADRATELVGELVFVSNRDSADGGEIWALHRGTAARSLSRSHFVDAGAAVSPDGGTVAFWSDRNGPWQLFVVGLDGRRLRPVLTDPRLVYPTQPQFSDDGRRLVVAYPRSGEHGLRLASADLASSHVRRSRSPCQYDAELSPDGTRLACSVRGRQVAVLDVRGRRLFTVRGDRAIWLSAERLAVARAATTSIVDSRGTVVARLQGSAQAASADGRALALYGGGVLTIVDLASYRPLRMIRGRRDWTPYWVAFTPDARELGYTDRDERWRVTGVRGGAIDRLPAWGTWSLDGHYAYPRRTAHGRVEIMVGDRRGRDAKAVGRFWYDDHGTMRLTGARGDRFVYESSGIRSHGDLWTVRPDGTGLRRLISTGDNLSAPAWAADGGRLAFTSAAGPPTGLVGLGEPQVVIADPDGRNRVFLPAAGDVDRDPAWSPDGSTLALKHGWGGAIQTVHADGTDRRVVVRSGWSPAWAPDGSRIAYGQSDGVHTVSPTGGDDRTVLRLEAGAGGIAWSPDGSLLAYTSGHGLFVASSDGSGSPRRLPSPGEPSDPTFSPDGTELAFAAFITSRPRHLGLFLVRVDGTRLRPLVSRWYDAYEPAWRPTR